MAPGIPTHVQNWSYACAGADQACHEAQNVGIPAAWTAAHLDWNEVYYRSDVDSTAARLTAAGAHHIVTYIDPNIAWYCPIPRDYTMRSADFPENGADCGTPVSQHLHARSGSYAHGYLHQANGSRLFDHADGPYAGKAGEPYYIGDPDVQAAFHAVTLQNRYATDVFEDDGGGSYNCIVGDDGLCSSTYGPAQYAPPVCSYTGGYWCYKYGETAVEWDRQMNPQQAYANDAIALADASALPVIGNNGLATDAYDLQWLAARNVRGAMLEGAWTERSDTTQWMAKANAILLYHSLHKFVVEYSSEESRLYFQIASHWIVYDPMYSVEALTEVNPAARVAGAQDTTFPEESIVPTRPRIATSPSNDVAEFQVAPGIFVREYADCYEDGSPIGYCAAVVNTTGSPRALTGLTQTYTRVMVRNMAATWAAGGAPLWSTPVPASIAPNEGLILAR
ncbi:MAG TPA: hypothetical protein VIN40_07095 [Candidatus Tyrphobacter sp.]